MNYSEAKPLKYQNQDSPETWSYNNYDIGNRSVALSFCRSVEVEVEAEVEVEVEVEIEIENSQH